jgi:MFS transporter, DHA1 family, tetracycline resistance protein
MSQTNFKRLLPLLLVIFLDSFSFFIVLPILLQLFYQNDLGLLSADTSLTTRNILTGIAISTSTCAALLASPFIGSLSDKYGRKSTMLICLSGLMVGFILPIIGVWQKSIFLILTGRFFSGVGSASQPVAQAAVADVCAGKEKSFYFSLIALMMTLPIIIGPLAGGYLSDAQLVSWFSVTTPFYAVVVLALAAFIMIVFSFKETLIVHSKPVQIIGIWHVMTHLSGMMKRYQIGFFCFIFFFLELGWSQYYQSIFLYLHQTAHYSAQLVSLYNAYMGGLMSIGLMFLYPLFIRHLSVSNVMRMSLALALVGFLGIALLQTALAQWVFAPFVAIFAGIGYVSLLSLISNRVDPLEQGKMMGYASTLLYIAWMVTAFNGGWLISLFPACPLYVAAAFLVLANVGVLLASRRDAAVPVYSPSI